MSKTIFITGASGGFGRIWTEAFLQRGDRVVATARNLSALEDLREMYDGNILTIKLDVTDRDEGFAAIREAAAYFGSIDVLINNAGYGLFGAVEETTEKEARDQIETNFFGLLWVTQAVLPVMRAQGYGHIIQVSSILGVVTMPMLGLYNASKFAVEGLSDTLAKEVKDFGVKVTMVEPNGFNTDWSGSSAIHTRPMKEYDPLKATLKAGQRPDAFGDPHATAEAILELVDSEQPPLRLLLGKVAYPWAARVYEDRLAEWEKWSEVAMEAHGQ
jgi:NAD(P)-dependent dehydrogenase (short-subunit alcohol dehydrogenase family)